MCSYQTDDKSPETAIGVVLLKEVFLKISINSQENTCARVSFLIKLQASDLQLYQKKTLALCFLVNLSTFLRKLSLQNTSGRLLLDPQWSSAFLLKSALTLNKSYLNLTFRGINSKLEISKIEGLPFYRSLRKRRYDAQLLKIYQ